MANTKITVEGKTFKRNIPTEKVFDRKRYYNVYSGGKRGAEVLAKEQRNKGNLARVVKNASRYENVARGSSISKKKPYSVYVKKREW